MTEKRRVSSAVATHSFGQVKQGNSEYKVTNHQDDMLLIDPEEVGNVSTHSEDMPKMKGAKKAPVSAALRDEQRAKGGRLAEISNEVDPASGYLEQESGMPVIDNSVDDTPEDEVSAEFEDLADNEFEGEEGVEIEADEIDDLDGNSEFDELEADSDDMEDLGGPDVEPEAEETDDTDEEEVETLAFEEDMGDTESVSLLDADSVADDDTDDVAYATMANVVHVIKANRIIASMGPALARKVQMSDLYLSSQFQDVVQASVETKGLRKGLVQAGFVLAKVKMAAASKATAKVVEAKVQARLTAKLEGIARKDEAMEQAMAIASVGINRRFFKDAENPLRASLESELTRIGVRGAGRLLTAAFSEHGVEYSKAIVTLAQKIAAMPEEVRNQYAEALDLTRDSDFETTAADEGDDEGDFMELAGDEAEYDEAPASVTAALNNPARRAQIPALLRAGVKTTAAMSILNGNTSLV